MLAFVINTRSIVDSKRLKNVAEGAKPREAVLDIFVPFALESGVGWFQI